MTYEPNNQTLDIQCIWLLAKAGLLLNKIQDMIFIILKCL